MNPIPSYPPHPHTYDTNCEPLKHDYIVEVSPVCTRKSTQQCTSAGAGRALEVCGPRCNASQLGVNQTVASGQDVDENNKK